MGYNRNSNEYAAMDLGRDGRHDAVRAAMLAHKQLRSDFVVATVDPTVDIMVSSRSADDENWA